LLPNTLKQQMIKIFSAMALVGIAALFFVALAAALFFS
jgi:hypothetical protein